MTVIRQFSKLAIAVMAIAFIAPSEARERPDLPGRAGAKITRTVIFSVSSANLRQSIYRASITCELGQLTMRKMTDRTGTAPVSFTIARPVGPSRLTAKCIIMKSGYRPAYEAIELTGEPSPKLMTVEMAPL